MRHLELRPPRRARPTRARRSRRWGRPSRTASGVGDEMDRHAISSTPSAAKVTTVSTHSSEHPDEAVRPRDPPERVRRQRRELFFAVSETARDEAGGARVLRLRTDVNANVLRVVAARELARRARIRSEERVEHQGHPPGVGIVPVRRARRPIRGDVGGEALRRVRRGARWRAWRRARPRGGNVSLDCAVGHQIGSLAGPGAATPGSRPAHRRRSAAGSPRQSCRISPMPRIVPRRSAKLCGARTKSFACHPEANATPTRPPDQVVDHHHSSATRTGFCSGRTTLPARSFTRSVSVESAERTTDGEG